MWERQAAHINLKSSQLGGHDEVRPRKPPPTNGRLFSKPRHETGEYLLDGPDLLSIKAEAVSPLDVSVVLQNDALWKTPMLFKTQMELKRPGGFEGALK